MEKYRSILLADFVGELSSRSYRTRFTPFIAQAMRDVLTWQCGGVQGLGTDFPAITVRLTQHYAESHGKSVATIFVGAKSAFYVVLCDTFNKMYAYITTSSSLGNARAV